MLDTMDLIKKKKVFLDGLVKLYVFCIGVFLLDVNIVIVKKKEEKREGRIECDIVLVVFRYYIVNCTGIDDREGYLELKKRREIL